MGAVDLEPYVRAWHERFVEAETARRRLAETARARLPALTRYLVERYGVTRVWLFGSLSQDALHEHSDIDIAAEGLPPGASLFRAAAELDDLARPFHVDLVPLEDAFISVRDKILLTGELLYGIP